MPGWLYMSNLMTSKLSVVAERIFLAAILGSSEREIFDLLLRLLLLIFLVGSTSERIRRLCSSCINFTWACSGAGITKRFCLNL